MGTAAHFVLAVVVDGCVVADTFEAYGVEVTRNRLHPVEPSLAPRFLDGTVAHAARSPCAKHTVAALNDGGNPVAGLVFEISTLLPYHVPGAGCELVPDNGDGFVEKSQFFGFQRGSALSFRETAGTLALPEVAAKRFVEQVFAYQCIVDMYQSCRMLNLKIHLFRGTKIALFHQTRNFFAKNTVYVADFMYICTR